MSYKTILVHVDHSRHAAERIGIAARLAISENAHLVGAAMSGISRFIYNDSAVDLAGPIVAPHIDALYAQANAALARFDAIASQAGVLSHERRLIDDEPSDGLTLQARYADLVVIGQTDRDEPPPSVIADLPEYVMLNCARPVLLVPYAGSFDTVGSNALVAWDGSMSATRGITCAIPMLRRARNVTLALFNPSNEVHGEQPGADIALFMARHGIKVEVVQQNTELDAGNALLSMAADLRSDLLVMGGYGHARFREILLGGVTKTILQTMTLPVLMSH